MEKRVPFSLDEIRSLASTHPTPFYVYEEEGIRRSARNIIDAFSWAPSFKEYFAVKATPNPHILDILKEEGCGADCSSLPELILSEQAGISANDIMFTSNNTPAEEFKKAKDMGAVINLDAFEHVAFLKRTVGLPEMLSFRYNPGSAREGNVIIGKPEEAKFGMTYSQIMDAYRLAKEQGVKRFGLHTMIISNERRVEYFVETARMLFDIVRHVKESLGISIELVNFGGGIGIPYRPEEEAVDLAALSLQVKDLYTQRDLSCALALECGRFITGPHGYLVTTVRHLKNTYRSYAGVDATMANLMRPGMYGAYHHITVLGKESSPRKRTYDVVGSLCENNDKFAILRDLPELAEGDIIVIHDAGAHGHAMGFNYNGKLRSAEFLLTSKRSFRMIRRAETLDDYFATLSF